MTIKPKYKVGDILRKETDQDSSSAISRLQVIEIVTQTCYAGTQIFYKCRNLSLHKREYQEKWMASHHISKDQSFTSRYSEPELVASTLPDIEELDKT